MQLPNFCAYQVYHLLTRFRCFLHFLLSKTRNHGDTTAGYNRGRIKCETMVNEYDSYSSLAFLCCHANLYFTVS